MDAGRHLFPQVAGGINRILTRAECCDVMEATAWSTFPYLKKMGSQRGTVRKHMKENELKLLERATEVMLVSTGLALFKVGRDYSDSTVVGVMRDGLTLAMPNYYLRHKIIGKPVGIHWPGITPSPARTSAQRQTWEFRERLWKKSETSLSKVFRVMGTNAPDDVRMAEITSRYFDEMSGSGHDFTMFVDHVAWQLEQSGVSIAGDVLVYDTWGSGKTLFLIASALKTLFPSCDVNCLIGASYYPNDPPSVQSEFGYRYRAKHDGSWPFAEELHPDTGEPTFLIGRNRMVQESVALIESISCMLAAYNMAMRIEEGHDINGIHSMVMDHDVSDEDLVEFLFPS